MSALGYNPIIIGVSFLVMILAQVALLVLYGLLGDRYGYKEVLLIVEALFTAAATLLALTGNLNLIIFAASLGGFGGQGGGGLRGAFGPGSTALVGRLFADRNERIKRIGRLTFVGGIASIAGTAMLALHASLDMPLGVIGAFRALFGLSAAISTCSFIALLYVREPKFVKHGSILSKSSGKFVTKVSLSNFVSGIGIGLAIPLLPLWFKYSLGIGPVEISAIYTASSAVSAFSSLFAHRVSRENNQILIAASSRVINGLLLALMVLPVPALAVAALYVVRGISAGVGVPTRSAVTIGGVGSGEMGTATSITAVANRAALGSSSVGGYLLTVMQDLPLEVGGAFQLVGGLLFYLLLRNESRGKSATLVADESEVQAGGR
jgi:MFS family permease